ncbi:BgTH12-05526 [Blumeria graminis f. sp. triticale]|uniref:BgTH12-05526 n=1 Tax=Blumeria graminis f. sp. triticale TaxID=1689686 RepID=A0A9W4GGB8_BLUGR|nr:BgTH12-05526 [Blumeria graminis f. sp. triticale]
MSDIRHEVGNHQQPTSATIANPKTFSTTRFHHSFFESKMQRIHSFLILALFFIVFAAAENVEYKCSTKVTFDGDKMQKKLKQMTSYYQATSIRCKRHRPCIRKKLLKLKWHLVKWKRALYIPLPEGTFDLSVEMKPLEDESNKTPRRHRNIYQIVARCSKGTICDIMHVTEKPRGNTAQETICSKI